MKQLFLLCTLLATCLSGAKAEADPDFYIYLCFGQSNMEGQAVPEVVDQDVDPRFLMLASCDFAEPSRQTGRWYTAQVPIMRPWPKMGVADYFGRTMVAALPDNIRVGVVGVAIGGVSIEGYMSEKVENYLTTAPDWMKGIFAAYGNDPYRRLVDMARIAQQSGVIKGILLHQGETDNGQPEWLQKVKTIYGRLLSDLGLNAADVPLFAGETVNDDVGGVCSLHNTVIARLPEVIPTAHVVPSNGCPCADDSAHFTAAGYRTMGKRYAYEALRAMGRNTKVQPRYTWPGMLRSVYALDRLEVPGTVTVRVGENKPLMLWGIFADGHRENLSREATFVSRDFTINDGRLKADRVKKGTVTATYTDFLGKRHTADIQVSSY